MALVEIHREIAAQPPASWTAWLPAATGLVTSLLALGGVVWANNKTLKIADKNLRHAEGQATINRRWDLDQRRYDGLQAGLADLLAKYQEAFRAMVSQRKAITMTESLYKLGAAEVKEAEPHEREGRIAAAKSRIADQNPVHNAASIAAADSLNAFMMAYTRVQLQVGPKSPLIKAIHTAATDMRSWAEAQREALDSLISSGSVPSEFDASTHQTVCGSHTSRLMTAARDVLREFEDQIVTDRTSATGKSDPDT